MWVIILLLFLLSFKWICFTCSLPLVSIYFHHQKTHNIKQKTRLKKIEISEIKKKQIRHSRLKNYLRGYCRYCILQTAKIPSQRIRLLLYKHTFLVGLAKNVVVYRGVEIRAPHRLKLGRGSIIGDNAILDARNGITIGENVNLSSNVSIWTQQHDHRDPDFACNVEGDFGVNIGDRAWLGPNTIILHSVNIGEGAVVAAGAVVTKDVRPFEIVAGVPAKVIGKRNQELRYEFDGSYTPFC